MAKAKLQRIPAREERQPHRSTFITEDAIAQRAYALYRARGGQDGHDVEDWLQAERELREAGNSAPLLVVSD
jgi:Protein of unknown function (DUF2934)